jgi:branched-chain amino acid transport system permease protein
MNVFDIYLLEALINGVLLGGVLALLSLGLNLIFGVIDVVWICYAELIMLGMYGMYFLYTVYHAPIWARPSSASSASPFSACSCTSRDRPAPGRGADQPAPGHRRRPVLPAVGRDRALRIEFKNLGLRLPVLKVAGMFVSYSRLLAFVAALIGMVLVYLWLTRTYTGTAIRAIAQDRPDHAAHGVDSRRIYLVTSALGGGLAGLAACLLVLQYDVHPFVGLSFGPITFLICVLGRPRQRRRRVRGRLRVRRDHLGGRPLPRPRVGLRLRLRLLHRGDVRAARRG